MNLISLDKVKAKLDSFYEPSPLDDLPDELRDEFTSAWRAFVKRWLETKARITPEKNFLQKIHELLSLKEAAIETDLNQNPEFKKLWEALLNAKIPSIQNHRKKKLIGWLQPALIKAALRKKSPKKGDEEIDAIVAQLSAKPARKTVPKYLREQFRFVRHCRDNPEMHKDALYTSLEMDGHKGAKLVRECTEAGYLDWKTRGAGAEAHQRNISQGKQSGRPKSYPVLTD